MLRNVSLTRWIATLAACILLTTPALSQAPVAPQKTTPAIPTGRWVAEHPSSGGIGSWWDFRPNGTLTMTFGAMVTAPIAHTADTLTMPSGQVGTPPVEVKFRVEDNILFLYANNTETSFNRIGRAPSASDPLLGRWKPSPSKTHNPDPQMAAVEKAQANAIYVFSADGTESLRIPFGSREGTWDVSSHTFKFKEQSTTYTFQLSGQKLLLGQPPDNNKTDSYLPDTIFN